MVQEPTIHEQLETHLVSREPLTLVPEPPQHTSSQAATMDPGIRSFMAGLKKSLLRPAMQRTPVTTPIVRRPTKQWKSIPAAQAVQTQSLPTVKELLERKAV